MNYLPYTFPFKNLFSGSNINNLKSLVVSSPRTYTQLSLCSQFKLNQNKLLLSSKPFTNVRQYKIPATFYPEHREQSHGNVWVTERIISVGVLAVIPLALTNPSYENLECTMDVFISLHVHWGLETIFKDYLRPSIVGDVIPKFCDVYAALVSIYLAVALLWTTFYGIGVVKTIKHLWFLDPNIHHEE